MESAAVKSQLKGGEFLLKESTIEDIFIPEDFNEEQKMIRQTAYDFLIQEVLPHARKIDKQEDNTLLEVLGKFAELGFLGTHMPTEYGGLDFDNHTNTLISEVMGPSGSFTVAYAAHIGIGMLPILYFGTEEQKSHYLPRLILGELKASYCLTEPGSGSDALAAKTRADLSEDGTKYILNGQKMWISNAGFADIFIVFAKIGGEKFTGFIVERNTPGLTFGEEEEKMGIKGSSTRQVFFENVAVPVENLLGDIGKGHLIAFNVLNIGRYKLGALCLGGAQGSADTAIKYANERVQFGQAISNFGAIKYKIAEQAIRIFAIESAIYRVSGLIENKEEEMMANGKSFESALLGAAEEYAVECAILKVAGSEVLDFVVDEGVQIYGGYGYSADFPMDRAYRDSRINRIFEGTNEINRLLAVDMILKRAMKGELDLMGHAMAIQKELMGIPEFGNGNNQLFDEETKVIANMKKAILMVAGTAVQKYMMTLAKEQELIMRIADMAIDTFMAESILLRTQKLVATKGAEACALQIDMTSTYVNDAIDRLNVNGKNAINAMCEGDEQRMLLMGLKRFSKMAPVNTVATRRRIAKAMIDANKYPF